jgi:hypothetical protein
MQVIRRYVRDEEVQRFALLQLLGIRGAGSWTIPTTQSCGLVAAEEKYRDDPQHADKRSKPGEKANDR